MALPVLPDDPAALRSALQDATHRFDAALSTAEGTAAQRVRERLAALCEFEETLMGQAERLRALDAPEAAEAAAWLHAIEKEKARLLAASHLSPGTQSEGGSRTSGEQSEGGPRTSANQDEGSSRELTVNDAPGDGRTAFESPATFSAPRGPGRCPRTERELLVDTNALLEDADHLLKAAPVMVASSSTYGPRELECRVRVLVGRARRLQEEAGLHDAATLAGQRLHHAFGCLTRICKEFLTARSVFIRGLQRGHEEPWDEYQVYWEKELERITRAAREERDLSHDREKQAKRRRQIEEQNREIHAGLLVELEEHTADPARDELWVYELRTLVDECVHFGKPSDGRLLQLLLPHAKHFERGDEYRGLRKHLRAKCGVEFNQGGRDETSAGPPPAREAEVRRPPSEIEHLRGAFAGRRAALVGGSSREERRHAIQAFFGFTEVDWIEHERSETADGANLARRIENGRYDVVFFLARFSSHPLQSHVKQACKAAGVPFALVERGYGVSGLARALENLGPAHADWSAREAMESEPEPAAG